MIRLVTIGAVLFACSLSLLSAQNLQPATRTVVFHVTSVRQTNEASPCNFGTCNTDKYTIEGFAELNGNVSVAEYVLTCDEVSASLPHPHRNNICARVHAGKAYEVQLLSNSVSFPYSRLNKDFEANYNIVSEKESGRGAEVLLSQNGR
jgi:hypothetical protein